MVSVTSVWVRAFGPICFVVLETSRFGGCGVCQGCECHVPGLISWCGVGDCVMRDSVGSVGCVESSVFSVFGCHGPCG